MEIGYSGLINFKRNRQHATLNGKITVFFHRVEEESLNSTLMKNYLLETADSWNSVGNPVRSLYDTVFIRIPETYLNHMIGLAPGAVSKTKRVENL